MWECDCPPESCAEHRLKCLAGDRASGDELVRKFTPLVETITRRILGPNLSAEWEDARQAAFVRIFRGLDQWEGRAPFCHWLLVVADRAVRQYKASIMRTRGQSNPLGADEPVDPRPPDITLEVRDCIKTAYEQFPEEWRLIYDLTVQGMSREQIAKTLGKSLRTIQNRLKEIRDQLRNCLEQ
jgi:RNA polymerase sigma factor (sigma-70 family)